MEFLQKTIFIFQTTGQMMSSVRLYLLPEYTTEGRQHYHGEVSSVIRLSILIFSPNDWENLM